jgi:hypothetical protein
LLTFLDVFSYFIRLIITPIKQKTYFIFVKTKKSILWLGRLQRCFLFIFQKKKRSHLFVTKQALFFLAAFRFISRGKRKQKKRRAGAA